MSTTINNDKKDYYCQFIQNGKLITSKISYSSIISDLKKKDRKNHYILGYEGFLEASSVVLLGRKVNLSTRLQVENYILRCKIIYKDEHAHQENEQ